MLRRTHVSLLISGAIVLISGPAAGQELRILWAEFDPANFLQELVNEYTAETGVSVIVDTTPWPDFQTKAFAGFTAHDDAYDLVVGDSQWLGAASTGGHYVELTDFIKEHNLKQVMAPAAMTYYAEYPKDSGRYWAIPLLGDAIGWAYRKDWFEDPAEMRAFKQKYGYELSVPKTWTELRDIAEFFYRPDANPPRYGVAIYTRAGADALAMGFSNTLYSYGGELGDYATCATEGIVNSRQALQALEDYRELYSFTPPNWADAIHLDNNQAIIEGLVAMSMNYFAFFPSLINPAINLNAAGIAFFANPAGPSGGHASALGGQGISIISYSHNQEEAMKFLEWLIRDDTQAKWAELGGLPAHAKTLESPKFRNATPYNEAFYQSMFVVKDFWAVPYYAELLQQLNDRLGPYLVGSQSSAKEALDALAADWKATIAKYGCN